MFIDELIETTIIGLIFLINFFLWYGDYERSVHQPKAPDLFGF